MVRSFRFLAQRVETPPVRPLVDQNTDKVFPLVARFMNVTQVPAIAPVRKWRLSIGEPSEAGLQERLGGTPIDDTRIPCEREESKQVTSVIWLTENRTGYPVSPEGAPSS
eukprot:GHVU01112364.1.p1 GENE.GHVU01112364.1~~GHVU01112364.1.p1  ORF type:complete len:110 (-),score=4.28 GHVU01112364.1:609-938(-)